MSDLQLRARPIAQCARCGGLLFAYTARSTLEGKDYHFYCKYKTEQAQMEQAAKPTVVMATITGNGDPT